MNATVPKTTLDALINLMDEPDEVAFDVIRNRVLSFGYDAVAPLEIVLEDSFNPLVRERLVSIIGVLRRGRLREQLEDWIATGSSDLLRGFLLVTRTGYPDLDEEKIIIEIEQIRMDIWVELHDHLTSLETVRIINHVFFELRHFEGNKNEPAATSNNYLNKLLETRKGSPLTLGMLYLVLARRLGLPVSGVDLPQHFILACLTDTEVENPGAGDVLFYINPYNNGTVFTRREIELYIRQLKVKPEPGFFTPCPNPVIIRRLIMNLIFSHRQEGNTGEADELESLLTLFE